VLDIFARYHWPGNVRELANVIERAMVVCKSSVIAPESLPPHLFEVRPTRVDDEPELPDLSLRARGAGADPACPAGLGGQARRGGAPARPLAPDALPQTRPLRDLMNGGPMDETLYALCLSTDPALSSAVVAMLARIPSFAVTARELDYQLGPVELNDMREAHLAIVILGDDPSTGLAVIEEVHKNAPRPDPGGRVQRPHETIVRTLRAGADEFSPCRSTQRAPEGLHQVSALRARRRRTEAHSTPGLGGVRRQGRRRRDHPGRQPGRRAAGGRAPHGAPGPRPPLGDLALFLNLNPGYTLRDIATTSGSTPSSSKAR